MKDLNVTAFPVEISIDDEGKVFGIQTSVNSGFSTGLTKREYFASHILQGMLSNSGHSQQIHNTSAAVSIAIGYADELLNQLKDEKQTNNNQPSI